MAMLIESLQRLYGVGKVTKEKVAEMFEKGVITKEQYTEITGENYE